MKKSKKTVIIIISLSFILTLIGVAFWYLYIKTDVLKTNQEIFAKYFSQEAEKVQKILDVETIKYYNTLENEKKYTSSLEAKMIHSEGGEVSNPLNNLSFKLDIQNDKEQQYLYGIAQILYEDEIYLETEIIKDEEQYGVKFPGIKQFITIKNDDTISNIEENIGIEDNILKKSLDIIDGTDKIISQNKINELRNKYLNAIMSEMQNGTFTKQKKAIITYDNQIIETNAYSVLLTKQQVENIIQKEFEAPTMKITLYVQNYTTIRTVLEFGTDKITIENVEEDEKIQFKIAYLKSNDEETSEYNLEIIKENIEKQENFKISAEVIQGEENYIISAISNIQIVNNSIEHDLEISHKKNITTTSLVLKNIVDTEKDFEKAKKIENENYISLSSMQDETKREQLINVLKEIVPNNIAENSMDLIMKLGVESKTEEISQSEINKFNAKFEYYTGDEISAENTKKLLDIVKNNLLSYENIENLISKEDKINIKLKIEKNKTNQNAINEILERIRDNAKYKISISYQQTNGLIEYITIIEI